MDRLEAMSIVLAAVQAGSLSGAGRQLRMPLATVSRKVSDLEQHLGTRLFLRAGRQLLLTEAGRAYVVACQHILEAVGEAERAASGEYRAPKGELVITAPIVMGRFHVLPVINEFLGAFPDIDVRLLLADRIVDLAEDHVDLAIRIAALEDSSMIALGIGSLRLVVCASPSYLDRFGEPRVPSDLQHHDCVAFDALTASKRWSFSKAGKQLVAPLRCRLRVNTAEAAIDAAIGGVGLTRVLSYQVAEAVRAGTLRLVLRDFESAALPVSMIYPGTRLLPLKLRAFIDFAAPRLRERLRHVTLQDR